MSLCKDFEVQEVCSTDASGVRATFFVHYEYGNDASGSSVLVATRYTDAAGVVVNLSKSKVTAGACPVYQPDVEFERLCDVQADGTFVEFLCRTITSFDTSGVVIDPAQVAYFELDKVTVYVPTGVVGPCPDCPPAVAQGVLTSWGSSRRTRVTDASGTTFVTAEAVSFAVGSTVEFFNEADESLGKFVISAGEGSKYSTAPSELPAGIVSVSAAKAAVKK